MTDEEIIAVVSAHKEGRKIEVNLGMGWLELSKCRQEHYPNFQTGSFRVAPEPRKPREWVLAVVKTSVGDIAAHPDYLNSRDVSEIETVRVREVLE